MDRDSYCSHLRLTKFEQKVFHHKTYIFIHKNMKMPKTAKSYHKNLCPTKPFFFPLPIWEIRSSKVMKSFWFLWIMIVYQEFKTLFNFHSRRNNVLHFFSVYYKSSLIYRWRLWPKWSVVARNRISSSNQNRRYYSSYRRWWGHARY